MATSHPTRLVSSSRDAHDVLLATWKRVGTIPGLPLRSRSSRIYYGGFLFSACIFLLKFAGYMLVLGYAILYMSVQLAWAIFLTLAYWLAKGAESHKARKNAGL